MTLQILRTLWASASTLGLLSLNVACAEIPQENDCERRVIVHFLQPVTAQQGADMVRDILTPVLENGLQVHARTHVNTHTVAYALSAKGCRPVEQAIETLKQASGSRISRIEEDARQRVR